MIRLLFALLLALFAPRDRYVPGYRKQNGRWVRGHWKR
jgi:hypothetical protein